MKESFEKIDQPKKISVPESEIEFIFSRSAGKGGQNVNKVATKVMIRWNVWQSKVLTPEQKGKIAKQLKNRVDKNGNFPYTKINRNLNITLIINRYL